MKTRTEHSHNIRWFQVKELRQPRPYVELIATRGKVSQSQTLPDDNMLIAKVAKDWSIDDGHLIRVADSIALEC